MEIIFNKNITRIFQYFIINSVVNLSLKCFYIYDRVIKYLFEQIYYEFNYDEELF